MCFRLIERRRLCILPGSRTEQSIPRLVTYLILEDSRIGTPFSSIKFFTVEEDILQLQINHTEQTSSPGGRYKDPILGLQLTGDEKREGSRNLLRSIPRKCPLFDHTDIGSLGTSSTLRRKDGRLQSQCRKFGLRNECCRQSTVESYPPISRCS